MLRFVLIGFIVLILAVLSAAMMRVDRLSQDEDTDDMENYPHDEAALDALERMREMLQTEAVRADKNAYNREYRSEDIYIK